MAVILANLFLPLKQAKSHDNLVTYKYSTMIHTKWLWKSAVLPSCTRCTDVSLCLGTVLGVNGADLHSECCFIASFIYRVMRSHVHLRQNTKECNKPQRSVPKLTDQIVREYEGFLCMSHLHLKWASCTRNGPLLTYTKVSSVSPLRHDLLICKTIRNSYNLYIILLPILSCAKYLFCIMFCHTTSSR